MLSKEDESRSFCRSTSSELFVLANTSVIAAFKETRAGASKRLSDTWVGSNRYRIRKYDDRQRESGNLRS